MTSKADVNSPRYLIITNRFLPNRAFHCSYSWVTSQTYNYLFCTVHIFFFWPLCTVIRIQCICWIVPVSLLPVSSVFYIQVKTYPSPWWSCDQSSVSTNWLGPVLGNLYFLWVMQHNWVAHNVDVPLTTWMQHCLIKLCQTPSLMPLFLSYNDGKKIWNTHKYWSWLHMLEQLSWLLLTHLKNPTKLSKLC